MKIKTFITLFILIICQGKVVAQWHLFYHNYSSDFKGVFFTSPDSGFCGFSHYISPSSGSTCSITQTTDGANTWQIINTAHLGSSLYALSGTIKGHSVYYITSGIMMSKLYSSGDDGVTWNQQANISGGESIIWALDETHFYLRLCTNFSKLPCNISLGGVNVLQFTSSYPTSLFFPDTNTAYLSLNDTVGTMTILKSVDGGNNWLPTFNDSAQNIKNIFFPSLQTGYGVGKQGQIIKTSNAGQSWQRLNTGVTDELGPLYFINDSIGYVAADSGAILHTTDGGMHWIEEYTGSDERVGKIHFVNDTFAFAYTEHYVYSNHPQKMTGLSNLTTERSLLNIYPNPANEEVNILLPNQNQTNNWRLEILDCTGRVVKAMPMNSESKTFKINTSAFDSGLYIARVADGNKNFIGKFSIE